MYNEVTVRLPNRIEALRSCGGHYITKGNKNMRFGKMNRVLCLGLGTVLLVTGCAGQRTVDNTQTAQASQQQVHNTEGNLNQLSEERKPEAVHTWEYEIPVSTVKVLVDRNGYQTERDKEVFFLGEELTSSFRVVKAENHEVVYTGDMQDKMYDDNSKGYMSRGDFSSITQPGRYYVETDVIGRSYTFEIAEDRYEKMFQSIMKVGAVLQPEQTPEAICNVTFGMHTLFLALQYHGSLFETDNDLVTQMLRMAEWLLTCQSEDGSLYADYEATASFCGIMTMCADNFGKYDSSIAKNYKTAATKAWKWMEKQPQDQIKEDALFYATAQLFRSEGTAVYQNLVTQYLTKKLGQLTDNLYHFLGATLYIASVDNTSRDLCTKIMQEFVDETEKICEVEKQNPSLVYTNVLQENLHKVLLICFVDYITPSNEYAVIMENTLHYIAGRNETGAGYLDAQGNWNMPDSTVSQNYEWNSILIFFLSDLMDR